MPFFVDKDRGLAVHWSGKCGCTGIKSLILYCAAQTEATPLDDCQRGQFRTPMARSLYACLDNRREWRRFGGRPSYWDPLCFRRVADYRREFPEAQTIGQLFRQVMDAHLDEPGQAQLLMPHGRHVAGVMRHAALPPHDLHRYRVIVVLRSPLSRLMSCVADKLHRPNCEQFDLWPDKTPLPMRDVATQAFLAHMQRADPIHFGVQCPEAVRRLEGKVRSMMVVDIADATDAILAAFQTPRADVPANVLSFRGGHAAKAMQACDGDPFTRIDRVDAPCGKGWEVKMFTDHMIRRVRKAYHCDFELARRHGLDYEAQFRRRRSDVAAAPPTNETQGQS